MSVTNNSGNGPRKKHVTWMVVRTRKFTSFQFTPTVRIRPPTHIIPLLLALPLAPSRPSPPLPSASAGIPLPSAARRPPPASSSPLRPPPPSPGPPPRWIWGRTGSLPADLGAAGLEQQATAGSRAGRSRASPPGPWPRE